MSELLISNNFHPLSSTDSNLIENSWSGFGLTPDLPRRDMFLSSRSPSASSSDSMDSISTIIDQGSRQGNSILYTSEVTWRHYKIVEKKSMLLENEQFFSCFRKMVG